MKKSMRRIITLCMAVIMLASVMSISSFAATKTYDVYTSLGDSIPAGYGLESYNYSSLPTSDDEWATYNYTVHDNFTEISGSYPSLVSKGVSAKTTNYYARCGYRTVELRALLDPSYTRTDLDQYMLYTLVMTEQLSNDDPVHTAYATGEISTYLKDFNDGFYAQKSAYEKVIRDADLITLNFGSNDTMSYGLYNIKTSDGWATEMAAGMQEGYERFKENFNWICKYIYSVNPDVKIAVVGMYNPFRGATLTDSTLLPLGDMADTFVGLVNTFLSTTCPYSSKYTYVDVTNTTSWGFDTVLEDVLSFDKKFTVKVHPNDEGHQYMANQILKTLNCPLVDVKDAVNTTNSKIISQTKDNITKVNQNTKTTIEKIKGTIGSGSIIMPLSR